MPHTFMCLFISASVGIVARIMELFPVPNLQTILYFWAVIVILGLVRTTEVTQNAQAIILRCTAVCNDDAKAKIC